MLKADISPLGLFCIIVLSVILLVQGLLFSEFMRLRHELHYMRKKLEEGTEAAVHETLRGNKLINICIFKFKKLTPDEPRN